MSTDAGSSVVTSDSGPGHPETFCQECGGPNVTWFAPNEVWNLATDNNRGLILCPICFIRRASARGIDPSAWRVEPEMPVPESGTGGLDAAFWEKKYRARDQAFQNAMHDLMATSIEVERLRTETASQARHLQDLVHAHGEITIARFYEQASGPRPIYTVRTPKGWLSEDASTIEEALASSGPTIRVPRDDESLL
jgi:hypothetical protein